MIFMIQTKLSNHPCLNEMLLGMVLTIIGHFLLYRTHLYDIMLEEKYRFTDITRLAYLNSHPEFNYLYGIWIIPLCLGIILILDSFDILPDMSFKKIKKYMLWKIRQGIKEYKKWKWECLPKK